MLFFGLFFGLPISFTYPLHTQQAAYFPQVLGFTSNTTSTPFFLVPSMHLCRAHIFGADVTMVDAFETNDVSLQLDLITMHHLFLLPRGPKIQALNFFPNLPQTFYRQQKIQFIFKINTRHWISNNWGRICILNVRLSLDESYRVRNVRRRCPIVR